VTPSFNQGDFLEATIQSVFRQDYSNLEYIIIDGGSNDGSLDIIKKHDCQLSHWCSERDGGHYDAVNKGFATSTGEIMGWINSDDMYCPWALRTVASVMTALPQVEWLTTVNPLTWTCGGFCRGVNRVAGYSKASFLDGCHLPNNRSYFGWVQQESTFWRRSLWQRSGGMLHTQFGLAADFDLWARFFDHGNLYVMNSPLGGFRFQPAQRSRKLDDYLSEARISLGDARRRNGWRQTRKALITARRIPIVRRWAYRRPLYTANLVEPINPDLANCGWRTATFGYG